MGGEEPPGLVELRHWVPSHSPRDRADSLRSAASHFSKQQYWWPDLCDLYSSHRYKLRLKPIRIPDPRFARLAAYRRPPQPMLGASDEIKNTRRAVLILKAFQLDVSILLAVACLAPLLQSQEVHVRVLNGSNGKPITNECLNVWTGTRHGEHMVAATNKDGVAVLQLSNTGILAETSCPGWPARASRSSDGDAITVSGDRYITCQEYSKILPGGPPTNPLDSMPSYPVNKILDSGVSASNTCGKYREQAKPGELVLFMRPRKFLEKMGQ